MELIEADDRFAGKNERGYQKKKISVDQELK